MKKYNETVSGLDINELRNLSIELKLEGFGAFAPLDMVNVLEGLKSSLENDVTLEGERLDGARAVETVNGLRFVFVYRAGDWLLKSIKKTNNSSRDGLLLTLRQEAVKVRARNEIMRAHSNRGLTSLRAAA